MSKAIRINQTGGPEVLKWEEVEVAAPGPGQVLVRHTAIGVNYSDVYQRKGMYPMPIPGSLGTEAAGVVEAVGKKVKGFKKGDRVAYMFPVPGAYSEQRLVPADALIKLPAGVKEDTAAAMIIKGFTTHYLIRRTYKVKKGDWVLIQAAAGGVGLIMSQWCKYLGAKVIGVVSTADKAKLAKKNGCAHVILSSADVAAEVKKITKGKGVDVVYDGVGKDSFIASLDSLRPLGMLVSFGNASGMIEPFAPIELSKRGSLYLTRAGGKEYLSDPKDRAQAAKELFALVKKKAIKVQIGQRYALADAAQAHIDLEARKTVGSTVLVP
ncbi:MAG: quinone oxidoreductase [Steroidobacteraceae bacterium]